MSSTLSSLNRLIITLIIPGANVSGKILRPTVCGKNDVNGDENGDANGDQFLLATNGHGLPVAPLSTV